MTYTTEEAVAALFGDVGYWTTRTGTDLQGLIATHGAVVRTNRVGGLDGPVTGTPRFSIEVYASTYRRMWNAAETIATRLRASGIDAPPVVIDRAVVESAFAERPYTEGVRVAQATYRLSIRHNLRRA